MKRIIIIAMISAMVLTWSITAISDDMPPADAGQLWTYMTETNPYTGWGYWPGYAGIYPGKSPHGAYLKLYANAIALKAAREGNSMPPGAIIVKENYGKDKKTLMAITPMHKIKGYNPNGGDWYWVKYDPAGKALAAGQPKGCIQCHGVVKNKDWLFTDPK